MPHHRTLKDKLLASREECCETTRHFIPVDQLDHLVDINSVRNELKKEFNKEIPVGDARIICHESKKLFTVLRCGHGHFQSILDVLSEGITDEDLPLSRVELGYTNIEDNASFTLGRKRHNKCREPADHTNCVIKAFSGWDAIDITDLLRDQWLALAPVFRRSTPNKIPHFVLEHKTILPFLNIKGRKKSRRGGYGEVSQIHIHPAHQKLLPLQDPRNSRNPYLADKMLINDDNEEFRNEKAMLEAVTSKNHKHLMKLLATYRLDGKFHLLFLYANCNLRDYWNEVVPAPRWEAKTCIWVVSQMRGLASGIHVIHEYINSQPLPRTVRSMESTVRRPNYGANVMEIDPPEKRYGRHGDLKPENILWVNVEDEFGHGGYLQLADFGLSRFHQFESRSRVDPRNVNGSATYIPPELVLELFISRAYDIWSLGCVFLEFITWMLEGKQGLEKFTDKRKAVAHDNFEDDTFFTAFTEYPKHAKVRPGVESWIESLRAHRCCSRMVSDLLDLVQTKMLKVKAEDRIRSGPLEAALDAILKQGKQDASYLLERR